MGAMNICGDSTIWFVKRRKISTRLMLEGNVGNQNEQIFRFLKDEKA